MPYAKVAGLSLYYEELGPTDGTPLVLLHGAGGTIDDPVGGWPASALVAVPPLGTVILSNRPIPTTDSIQGELHARQ